MWYTLNYPRRRRARRLMYAPMSFNGGRRLPVDVHADDEAFVITAAVPGLTAQDLQIDILDDLLTLRGEIKAEENGHGEALLREIAPVAEFSRKLRLPEPVDADQAEAKVENGVLTVRIPKAESARPKQIEVKAS